MRNPEPADASWQTNKHNKSKGTAIEVLFRYECLSQGYMPHNPDGDPSCHDTVVMNPLTGKCKVVQVRGVGHRTLVDKRYRTFSYKTLALCLNKKLHLRDSIVDILAVFVIPEKVWYLIPVSKITAGTVTVRPHIPNSKGQYENYRGKWNTFGYGVRPVPNPYS